MRWSEGSRQLLVLAKQLDDRPRWLSCRRARSAFYDCEKAPIEPGEDEDASLQKRVTKEMRGEENEEGKNQFKCKE